MCDLKFRLQKRNKQNKCRHHKADPCDQQNNIKESKCAGIDNIEKPRPSE
jgi:hypothetical protein